MENAKIWITVLDAFAHPFGQDPDATQVSI